MANPNRYNPPVRHASWRPDGAGMDILHAFKTVISVILLGGASLLGYNYMKTHGQSRNSAPRQVALPMDTLTLEAIKSNAVPWTFTYLATGKTSLTLQHTTGSGPGAKVTGIYDDLTDDRSPYTGPVGVDARDPLFHAILDQSLDFFGLAETPTTARKFHTPSDFPERPLFVFETPGPKPGEHYVLVFGGDPQSGALSGPEQKVAQAVVGLADFIRDRGTGGETAAKKN